MMIRGVDVSALQGVVPWGTVARDIRFAYLRGAIGNETMPDARFVENVRAAKCAGVIVGAYFFAYPLPHLDPEWQAAHAGNLLSVDGKVVGASHGELPIALDLEWPPPFERADDGTFVNGWTKRGCNAAQIRSWALRALDVLGARIGCQPVLYTYPFFWERVIAGATPHELAAFSSCPLWIADYRTREHVPSPRELPHIPSPWRECGDAIVIWQHDGNGGLRLPNGVDADFNVLVGGENDLARLIGFRAECAPSIVDVERARLHADAYMIEEEIVRHRMIRIATAGASPVERTTGAT